jgi:hypothetical protein
MAVRDELKKIKEGQEFPRDFWNYSVNPITGFYFSILQEAVERKKKKYLKPNNGLTL